MFTQTNKLSVCCAALRQQSQKSCVLDCFLLLNKIALSPGRPQIGFLGNELQIFAILFGDTRVLDVIVLTESNKIK